jgi:hypothetical protein
MAPAGVCVTGLPRRNVDRVKAEVEQGALVSVTRVGFVTALMHRRTLLSSVLRCGHGRR